MINVNANNYLLVFLIFPVEMLIPGRLQLPAQLFLRDFEQISPLSKYLQTKGMEILSAHRMVTATQVSLKSITRDFTTVKAAADTFVKWTIGKLEKGEEEPSLKWRLHCLRKE